MYDPRPFPSPPYSVSRPPLFHAQTHAPAHTHDVQADRLEREAEVALLESELAIEQHLRDFPDADEE